MDEVANGCCTILLPGGALDVRQGILVTRRQMKGVEAADCCPGEYRVTPRRILLQETTDGGV